MSREFWVTWAFVSFGAIACSSGSGGSGNGSVTFSCNATTAGLCTQILVPQSEVSQETSTCTNTEMGTPGTGCPSANIVGCCKLSSGEANEEQCYYTATAAEAGKSACTGSSTWSTTL
jgi:hypothetical protein